MSTQIYLVALGGNVRGRLGTPAQLLAALVGPTSTSAIGVVRASSIYRSAPMGPGTRTFANAVALIESALMPPAFLAQLKAIERSHGRRSGRRWGNRILDLDIIGWSGGRWSTRTLTIPHAAFRHRLFVLEPLAELASDWRDAVTGLAVRHLLTRARRPVPNYSSPR